MHRIAFLCDSHRPITARLMDATLAYAATRPDVEVRALVTRHRRRAWDTSAGQRLKMTARAALVAATDRDAGFDKPVRFRVPADITVLDPSDARTNSAELVRRLCDALGIDVLFSLYYGAILSTEFLGAFPLAVNFHPGLLPRNRGLAPTAFARYSGDPMGGFTFHRMTPGIDEGPIIYQEAFPLDGPPSRFSRDMTVRSAAAIPTVFNRLLAGEPGTEQQGEATYHNRAEVTSLCVIHEPETIASTELLRRLQAFETLYLTIGGVEWPVTGLRKATGRSGALSFTAGDGIELVAHRIGSLPTGLVRLRRRLRR